ncbi:MAG: hypothetical protein K0B09_02605 [Bacteroidales bacterium]|nr:hypothetical protein [Bacteroidales bacterium]
MLGSLLIYLIFVLIPAISIYNKDKGQYRWVKFLNLLITFLLVYDKGNNTRLNFLFLKENISNLSNEIYIQIGIIPPIINYLGFFLDSIFTFLFLTAMIGLGLRNKKVYESLWIIIPIGIPFLIIGSHFRTYETFKEMAPHWTDLKIFIFNLLFTASYWIVFLVVYRSKKFRSFFEANFNEVKPPEALD